jgi:hypothetical protein
LSTINPTWTSLDHCGYTPAINCLILSERVWGVTTNCRTDLSFWSALRENWNSRNSHCSWLNPPYFNLPVTDEALMALHSLFGRPFEKALELLETSCVTYLRATGGRYVVQVRCVTWKLWCISVRACAHPKWELHFVFWNVSIYVRYLKFSWHQHWRLLSSGLTPCSLVDRC